MEDLCEPEMDSHTTFMDDLEQINEDEECVIFSSDGSFGNVYLLTCDSEDGTRLTPQFEDLDVAKLLIEL